MAEWIRVKNLGDKALNLAYNNRSTIIPPGGEGLVDREAAATHLGCWWAIPGGRRVFDAQGKVIGHEPAREDEVKRVKALYGCFPGGPAEQEWDERKPKVEIYDDGGKVSTVIDDPEGASVPITEVNEGQMRESLLRMQQQMAEMRAQLDSQEFPVQLPPADSPHNAPNKRRRPAEVRPADLQAVEGAD